VTQYFGGNTVVFNWSGSASASAMELAAEELHAFVLAYWQPGEPLNFVAHSDGGNVVMAYTWRSSAPPINTLITMGTPFIGFSPASGSVGTFLNVYSSNDLAQPFGAWNPLRGFVFAAIIGVASWNPAGFLIGYGLFGFGPSPVASRTTPCAINIGISNAPGVGKVGHGDLHSVPVWNSMISWLQRAGYGHNPANATVNYGCNQGWGFGGGTLPNQTRLGYDL